MVEDPKGPSGAMEEVSRPLWSFEMTPRVMALRSRGAREQGPSTDRLRVQEQGGK